MVIDILFINLNRYSYLLYTMDCTPEQVAVKIFTKQPESVSSYQIIAESDVNSGTYIYEILVTILLEGMSIFTKQFSELDLSCFSEDNITYFNPWMRSVGFNIHVDSCSVEDTTKCKGYYCRTVLKTEDNEDFFISKKLDKPYHFMLNSKFDINCTKLKDIKGLFINNDTVYIISFDFV